MKMVLKFENKKVLKKREVFQIEEGVEMKRLS